MLQTYLLFNELLRLSSSIDFFDFHRPRPRPPARACDLQRSGRDEAEKQALRYGAPLELQRRLRELALQLLPRVLDPDLLGLG